MKKRGKKNAPLTFRYTGISAGPHTHLGKDYSHDIVEDKSNRHNANDDSDGSEAVRMILVAFADVNAFHDSNLFEGYAFVFSDVYFL